MKMLPAAGRPSIRRVMDSIRWNMGFGHFTIITDSIADLGRSYHQTCNTAGGPSIRKVMEHGGDVASIYFQYGSQIRHILQNVHLLKQTFILCNERKN